MAYISNLNFGVGKLETPAGVAVEPVTADFNERLIDPQLTLNTETDNDAAKYARGDHAEAESVYGARSGQVTFGIRLCYSGDDATPPSWSKYGQVCGVSEVLYALVGVGFQPLKAGDIKTMTFDFYQTGSGASPSAIRTRLAGCMGNAVIGCDGIGKPWIMQVTLTGKLVGQTTVEYASIPIPDDMDQVHPEKFLNNSLYIDGVATKISSWSLDIGNDVQPIIDQSDPTGYAYYVVVNRVPRFSCNPLVEALTVDDPIGDIVSGCTGLYAVDPIVLKSNRLRFKIPRAQMLPPSVANREGFNSWDKTYKCMNNGYTGVLGDTGLPAECTWEILQGFHETGVAWSDTGMYM